MSTRCEYCIHGREEMINGAVFHGCRLSKARRWRCQLTERFFTPKLQPIQPLTLTVDPPISKEDMDKIVPKEVRDALEKEFNSLNEMAKNQHWDE